mmetsp:Transcript_4847/g.12704  ORF Transcript_4847/g.12704 Transcript_4847/m.12704 type:complete len:256 (+) Transcript_4847:111-878(+)
MLRPLPKRLARLSSYHTRTVLLGGVLPASCQPAIVNCEAVWMVGIVSIGAVIQSGSYRGQFQIVVAVHVLGVQFHDVCVLLCVGVGHPQDGDGCQHEHVVHVHGCIQHPFLIGCQDIEQDLDGLQCQPYPSEHHREHDDDAQLVVLLQLRRLVHVLKVHRCRLEVVDDPEVECDVDDDNDGGEDDNQTHQLLLSRRRNRLDFLHSDDLKDVAESAQSCVDQTKQDDLVQCCSERIADDTPSHCHHHQEATRNTSL